MHGKTAGISAVLLAASLAASSVNICASGQEPREETETEIPQEEIKEPEMGQTGAAPPAQMEEVQDVFLEEPVQAEKSWPEPEEECGIEPTEAEAEPAAEEPRWEDGDAASKEEEAGTDTDAEEETVTEAEEEIISEDEAETEEENVAEAETEEESEPETGTDEEKEAWTETEKESEAKKSTETEKKNGKKAKVGKKKKKKTEKGETPDSESESAEASEQEPIPAVDTILDVPSAGATGTGAIPNAYSLDENWTIHPDFRFTRVKKVPVLSEGSLNGVPVYEDTYGTREVGWLPYFSLAFVLEETSNEWVYIESDEVRGFARREDLSDTGYASRMLDEIGEESFSCGISLCEKADNGAYTYRRTTVYDVLAEKEYAILLAGGMIREFPSASSRAVGKAGSGALIYVLEDAGNGWLFVESGNVRGFLPDSFLLSGQVAKDLAADVGEEQIAFATEMISPEENRSLYYSLKSVRAASAGIGEQIAGYALSLVGKTKYIYGGTSLSSGADCSGFTESIFASAGIALPRTAEEQGRCGQEVKSLAEAQPGDILYYDSGPHVGIYIGNGKVVHCSGNSSNTAENPGRGAMVSSADYMPISSIRRYRNEAAGGSCRRDPTAYSLAEMELIWAIVAQEDNGSYEGALAVISSAMNRVESGQWASLGNNALAQLTANGQYCYSLDTHWMSRLNGNVPDYVKQAVEDCLHKGIRNHTCTCFRSYYTPGSVQVGGGNYYFS